MESGTWRVEKFDHDKIPALRLKNYDRKAQLKRKGAAWAWSIAERKFISDFSPMKKEKAVIIKTEDIGGNDLILLCIEGSFFAIHCHEVGKYMVKFTSWIISAAIAAKLQARQ